MEKSVLGNPSCFSFLGSHGARHRDLLVTPSSRVIDPLLQRSLEMWEALCATPEAHLFAEIVSTLAANATLSTWHANFKGHAVAQREVAHLRTDGDNHARRLVAK